MKSPTIENPPQTPHSRTSEPSEGCSTCPEAPRTLHNDALDSPATAAPKQPGTSGNGAPEGSES